MQQLLVKKKNCYNCAVKLLHGLVRCLLDCDRAWCACTSVMSPLPVSLKGPLKFLCRVSFKFQLLYNPLLPALGLQLVHFVIKLCHFCSVFFSSFLSRLSLSLASNFFPSCPFLHSFFPLPAVEVPSFVLADAGIAGGCSGTALSHATITTGRIQYVLHLLE